MAEFIARAKQGRSRAATRAPEARREEILDAAVRVFARTPYHVARTSAIAELAGIAEGMIFRHFPSKRALYLASLERSQAAMACRYRAIVADSPDTVTALRSIATCSQERATVDADDLRLRQRAVAESEDDDVRALLQAGYRQMQALVSGVMREGQARGVIDADVDAGAGAWQFLAGGLLVEALGLLGLGMEERLQLCRQLGDLQRRSLDVTLGQ